MCVYHYEDSRRTEIAITLLLLGCILFSFGVTVPMLNLTNLGDECLLFVSVRGEALIYGNPAGCNFIAYGHVHLVLVALIVLGFIFCRPKKGVLRRQKPKEIGSTRSLRGTQLSGQIGVGQSHYNFQSEDTVSQFGISRFYSNKAIVLSAFAAVFALISAMVILSGYLITCNELHYETSRQVLSRNTLGSPIRNLNIQCWSLFRDVDFHTRFHFDHYEYSGKWHGQYRGYNHGRVHQFESKHEHLIDVALALELSLSGAWFCAALWISVTILMFMLKKRQKQLQARELAESLEDAKIFASSRQLDPSQNIMMRPMSDQMSVTSNQSSILSQKPSVMSGNSVSTQPMGTTVIQNPNGVPMVVQQQMLSQQEILNQQMLQMQQLQLANQQRLHQSQPVLTTQVTQHDQRPMSQQIIRPIQAPITQQTQQLAQQQYMTQQTAQIQQQQQQQQQQYMSQQTAQIQQQQQYMSQQNGVQYVQLSNGMLMPVVTQPQTQQIPVTQQVSAMAQQQPTTIKSVSSNQHHYSELQIQNSKDASNSKSQSAKPVVQTETDSSKSKSAQRAQLNLSQDAGLKCSQI